MSISLLLTNIASSRHRDDREEEAFFGDIRLNGSPRRAWYNFYAKKFHT